MQTLRERTVTLGGNAFVGGEVEQRILLGIVWLQHDLSAGREGRVSSMLKLPMPMPMLLCCAGRVFRGKMLSRKGVHNQAPVLVVMNMSDRARPL